MQLKNATSNRPHLQFAFVVGHSFIGWAIRTSLTRKPATFSQSRTVKKHNKKRGIKGGAIESNFSLDAFM